MAAQFIALIGKLYQFEAQAGRTVSTRPSSDADASVAILAAIESLLLANVHAVLPKRLLGQALHYLASQWSKLKRFVDTVAGANASANLYSLLQTCKVNGIDGCR